MAGIKSPGRSKRDFVSIGRTSCLRRAPALLGTLLAGVLLLAACGQSVDGTGTGVSPSTSEAAGSSEAPDSPDSAAGEPSPTEDAVPDLPALTVENVAGGRVDLASYFPAEKPVAVWFWAPHCSTCRKEAPDVETFATEHDGRTVTLIGLGAQDSLEMAKGFVEKYGPGSATMLWDPSGESWIAMDVYGQPVTILLDRNGHEVRRWFTSPSSVEDEFLEAAAQVT